MQVTLTSIVETERMKIMRLNISFKHFKRSSAVEERIREKSERFIKYFYGWAKMSWLCYEKDKTMWSEVNIVSPDGDFHAKAHAENLYKSFDLVVEKLEKQIAKKKDKFKNKVHSKKSMDYACHYDERLAS